MTVLFTIMHCFREIAKAFRAKVRTSTERRRLDPKRDAFSSTEERAKYCAAVAFDHFSRIGIEMIVALIEIRSRGFLPGSTVLSLVIWELLSRRLRVPPNSW